MELRSAADPAETAVLDREIYTEREAARLLDLAPSTLRCWLQGGVRHGVADMPILRAERSTSRHVTWAEFIEAGWLRAYRATELPMRELRRFIELLRDRMGVPYPLAQQRPLVSGQELVLEAQVDAGLDPHWWLVDEQLVLTYPARRFMERVVREGGVAAGWRPAADPASTVVVRPNVRFGRPSVSGVSTLSLFDYAEEGASRDEIADEFGLSVADVRWALAFENARHVRGASGHHHRVTGGPR